MAANKRGSFAAAGEEIMLRWAKCNHDEGEHAAEDRPHDVQSAG